MLYTSDTFEGYVPGGVRIVSLYDNSSGCPNASRTNPLLSSTVTLSKSSYVWFMGSMIRNFAGRTDLYIQLNGSIQTYRLNWCAGDWEQTVFDHGFFLGAGTHTFSIAAASPGLWGCGRWHGRIFMVIFGG